MEFTYNHDQLYANISYVDFVSFPIALALTTSTGVEKTVAGLCCGGAENIAAGLLAQQDRDNQRWGDLIVKDAAGELLRVLSPNQGMVLDPSLFVNYFDHAASGPFQTGPDAKKNAIIPRLNAEMNRSVIHCCEDEVPCRDRGRYHQHEVTNHYARLVHEANVDGKGYAHPYDDVAASGGEDHSGYLSDGAPQRLDVTVGRKEEGVNP
ncbi:hypothetical protein DRE_01211 [Drechslerella stenobrocha 248]|uniref:GH64 domain-containing protein n=1 Tax=Drechslerella stenobrocha 248 TaxID=1043628 RepID=W7I6G2_9PEZI|nr:hypothetical protein DRE_01211 [Drechslerella stenobrocha 248]